MDRNFIRRAWINLLVFGFVQLVFICNVSFSSTNSNSLILRNDDVLREMAFDGQVWRTVRFARGDGSSEVKVESDEFHILLMDDHVEGTRTSTFGSTVRTRVL